MNNDTHGATGQGWYGFDLDGTLAVYDKWQGIDHIGEPIKPMVDLIKKMHGEGKVVRIMTARVAPRKNKEYVKRLRCDAPDYVRNGDYSCLVPDAKALVENMYLGFDTWGAYEFVVDWCLKNLGFLPEITHEKDYLMLELYDDRVKQVIPNKGELVEDIAQVQSDEVQRYKRIFKCYEREILRLSSKLDCKFNGFAAGMMLGFLIASAINLSALYLLLSEMQQDEALDHPHSAIIEVQEAIKN